MSTPAPNRERQRAAYLITFGCYGSSLHGREGAVDREHNTVGNPFLAESAERFAYEKRLMTQKPYHLDAPRRAAVMAGLRTACKRRGWMLLAAHVRPSHVHVVVEADRNPELVMSALKAYASRKLNESEHDRRRWARHGSTWYLRSAAELRAAVYYVISKQGEAMETFMPASS